MSLRRWLSAIWSVYPTFFWNSKRNYFFSQSCPRFNKSQNWISLAEIGYILTFMAQMVKNLPAVQETWFQPLGGEDPLEKEMATHSSILAGEFRGQRILVGYSPRGCKELDVTEWLLLEHEYKALIGLIWGVCSPLESALPRIYELVLVGMLYLPQGKLECCYNKEGKRILARS